MKKVNKQCLLDAPRTIRVSEKTWQVIVQVVVEKISVESVQTKIINSFMHIDWPMKAPSMHIQKPS